MLYDAPGNKLFVSFTANKAKRKHPDPSFTVRIRLLTIPIPEEDREPLPEPEPEPVVIVVEPPLVNVDISTKQIVGHSIVCVVLLCTIVALVYVLREIKDPTAENIK